MTTRRVAKGDHVKLNSQPVLLYVYRGNDFDAGRRDVPWQSEQCGTYAGWNEHMRNREPRCDRCKRAHADYVREWRLRTGRVKTVRVRLTAAQLALLQRSTA